MKYTMYFAGLIACFFSIVAVQAQENKFLNSPARKLQLAEFAIANLYVDEVNEGKLVEEAIVKMLEQLDPHSTYSDPEEVKKMNEPLQGNFEGIGIQFNMAEDTLLLIQPVSGGPSEKAGILAGDRIVMVEDTLIAGVKMSTEDIMRRLRGPKDSKVNLKILRRGVKELLPFTVKRDKIPVYSLDASYMIKDKIGYIRINRFAATTHEEFKKALAELQKKGMKDLILDLQGNGGGYLNAAIDIANEFLGKKELIVYTEGRRNPRSEFFAKGTGEFQNGRLIVLVDEFSASASEIVTGAIQDWDRGIVVGRRTFGKGLVQVPRSLPYGGTMKVTTSKYYIPSGRCVQAIDYKHRNEDGSVGTIPDSLTKVFHTAAGREVRDGGGVMPDIVIKQEKLPNILFYLVRDNLIFDYATQYCLKHPTIVAPEKFEVTDADYNDFKALVKKADFKYDQQSEKILKTLKEAAEFEGYMDDASEEFKALEKKLNHDLDRDLDYFSSDIKKMIATEIIKRYYYQRGNIIQQLKDDDGLKEAMKILNDPVKYKEMLSAPAAKE